MLKALTGTGCGLVTFGGIVGVVVEVILGFKEGSPGVTTFFVEEKALPKMTKNKIIMIIIEITQIIAIFLLSFLPFSKIPCNSSTAFS